jgi:hypothetical protein
MALEAPNPGFRSQDKTKAPLAPISLQAQPKLALTSQPSLQFKAQSLLRHQLIHQPSMLLDQLGDSPLQDLRLDQSQFRRPVAPPHQQGKRCLKGVEGQSPTLPFPNLHGAFSRAAGQVGPARR